MTSAPTPFSLPAHVALKIAGGELVVRHGGDVTLEQTLGRKLARIESGGDVSVHLSRITGHIQAAGDVSLAGAVDAAFIEGRHVHIRATSLRAKAIYATGTVTLDCDSLAVDAIVASEVIIDPAATGHVRLIHGQLRQRPDSLQGCLSLHDFEQRYGDPVSFLRQRGITLTDAERQASAPTPASAPPHSAADPVQRALARIQGAYGDSSPPDPVQQLLDAAQRGPDTLIRTLDAAWASTLRAHARLGAAPPRAAVIGFLALRDAVQG